MGAGRVLELILLLEHHWSQHRLVYPLAFLSPMAYNTLEFAKSQVRRAASASAGAATACVATTKHCYALLLLLAVFACGCPVQWQTQQLGVIFLVLPVGCSWSG